MCPHLLSASRVEISPNLTENVPPKPQQVSHSAISSILETRDLGEKRARLRLDAHLAQPGAAVVVGHRAVEAPRNALETQLADEKIGELARLRGERLDAREHRRIVGEADRDSACGSSRCTSPTARRRSRSPRTRRRLSPRAPSRPRGRRSCTPAARNRSASGGRRRWRRPASSRRSAAKPIDGRIRSTRQVTKRPTRIARGRLQLRGPGHLSMGATA